MTRNKLYVIVSTACVAGYSWLYFSRMNGEANITGTMCLFKQFTGLPCPSCGSTRSILQIVNGNFLEALSLNPLGYVLLLLLVMLPLWIGVDVITKKASLYASYLNSEGFIKQKFIAIPLIFIVTLNWIWNIYKGV